MALSTPEWLARRGATVKTSGDGQNCFVVINGRPDYALSVVPVAGKFGCAIRQTINGTRIDSPGTQPTSEAALRQGLEDLGKALGWV